MLHHGAFASPSRPPIRLEAYVGRERERAFLRERMISARRGAGSAIVITGFAGMGKSRLLGEIAAYAHELDVAVVDLVAPHAVTAALAIPSGIAARLRALRLIDDTLDGCEPTSHTPDEFERWMPPAIARAARTRPLAIVIDDAQRLDDATLLLFERLAKAVTGLAVVFVVTVRAEDRAARPRLAASLARIEATAAGFAIRLDPLPDDALEPALLEAVRGIAPLTARDRDAVLARAAGNPYFAEELLRAYIAGTSPRTPSPNLTAAIAERFGRLEHVAQHVLRVAAAIGPAFDIDVLARTASVDDPTLFGALRAARDAGLIVENEHGATFLHALAREAIDGTFDPGERRRVHHALTIHRSDADIVERARHAIEGGARDAGTMAETAGDALMARFAPADALRFFEAALERTGNGDEDGARLREKIVAALERLDEPANAREPLLAAIALHERGGRYERALHDVIDLGRLAFNAGDVGESVGALEHARRLFPHVTVARRHRARMTFALVASMANRWKLASALVAEIEAELPDDPESYRFHRTRALVRATLGDPGWREEAATTAALLAPVNGPVAVFSSYSILTYAALSGDDPALATVYAGRSLQSAREAGTIDVLVGGLTTAAEVELFGGRLASARTFIDEALDTGAERASPMTSLFAVALQVAVLTEDEALLQRIDVPALEQSTRTTSGRHIAQNGLALSEWYERRNDQTHHRALFDRLCEGEDDGAALSTALARAARFASPATRVLAERLLVGGATRTGSQTVLADLALFRAYAAERERKAAETLFHARAAADAYARVGKPLFEARARELANDDATALEIFERCGDTLEARRLRARIARERQQHAGERLSNREREVACALAAGETADEVARRLFLSRRTVETHIASAYRKLGVSNRNDLRTRL